MQVGGTGRKRQHVDIFPYASTAEKAVGWLQLAVCHLGHPACTQEEDFRQVKWDVEEEKQRENECHLLPWAAEENMFKICQLFSFPGGISLNNFRNKIARYFSTLQLTFLDFPYPFPTVRHFY